ncbi:MAG: class I SAM-dependent methyltransferase, partial [Acidimicrobiia bacterium]
MSHDQFFADNLANWNDRVPIHAGPGGYGIDEFASDPELLSPVVAFDKDQLGDVSGRTLLHLQCHIGMDTLSWARLGAVVTGVDFSGPALEVARRLASDLGVDAEFIESNLYESPTVLSRQFDLVYTSVGAVTWLPDIRGWAAVAAALTKPGGTFYVRDGHPMLWATDTDRDDGLLVIRYPYFEQSEPLT